MRNSLLGKKKRDLARWIAVRLPFTRWWDRYHLTLDFYAFHGRWPGSGNTFNDVVHDVVAGPECENLLRQITADKELSKFVCDGMVAEQISVPTLAVLKTPAEVRAFDFPTQCVIKSTHASGQTIVRKDASDVDIDEICSWFEVNYYRSGRERVYANLVPKVIVEPIIFDGAPFYDLKVFCRKGTPRFFIFVGDALNFGKRKFFTLDWEPIKAGNKGEPDDSDLPDRPEPLGRVLELTRKIATHFDFVRVDWMICGSKVLLGEISHGHMRAQETFDPPEREEELSKLLN